jgi:hypothetical protein
VASSCENTSVHPSFLMRELECTGEDGVFYLARRTLAPNQIITTKFCCI